MTTCPPGLPGAGRNGKPPALTTREVIEQARAAARACLGLQRLACRLDHVGIVACRGHVQVRRGFQGRHVQGLGVPHPQPKVLDVAVPAHVELARAGRRVRARGPQPAVGRPPKGQGRARRVPGRPQLPRQPARRRPRSSPCDSSLACGGRRTNTRVARPLHSSPHVLLGLLVRRLLLRAPPPVVVGTGRGGAARGGGRE